MDPNFPASNDFINGYQYTTHWDDVDDVQHPYHTLLDPPPYNPAAPHPLAFPQHTSTTPVGVEGTSATMTSLVSSLEDTDFSETVKFICQVLMEEDVEHRPSYDPLSLQLTEKSFYDVLGDTNIPVSRNQHPLHLQSPDGGTTATNSNDSADSRELNADSPDTPLSADHGFQFNSLPISQPPPSNRITVTDGMLVLDSRTTKLLAQNIFSDADSVSLFRRGLEEASKFLPPGPQLVTGRETITVSLKSKATPENVDKAVEENSHSHGIKSRKNHEREGSDAEGGRSNKQSAVSGVVDESDLSDMFDRVLLNVGNMPLSVEVEHKKKKKNGPPKAFENPVWSDGGKRQGKKKETIDLTTLLLLCAQAASANETRTANELLKQIRQHSSPFGDASQRLAHYFANGLEARLLGDVTGAQDLYTFLSSSKRITAAECLKAYQAFTSATEYLKAYQVFISACPFRKFAYFFANKMIMNAAIKAETLHIIDFGILYGFQWPLLIKFLSERDGGPPKLRITGIEFPQSGFRPAERILETGRRLANYCERFKVPFEYNAIASRNWESIQVEDLKIKSNELLAVNCLVRFKNLLDETIEVNSPRNAVLHLIRKINPDIFVQSIINASYNAPFFNTRFRAALLHFSAIYDMCDAILPHETEGRMVMEREIFGREAMNVVACEGFERVERPETYKQWQVRNTRAGFKQLPLNDELMAKFRSKLRQWYHRDFLFDEDSNWMLQGWKGRIMYASTCWVPA